MSSLTIDFNLSAILLSISANTWQRLRLARRFSGFRYNETTLTQELVYTLYQASLSKELPIKVFESKLEKTNGNDLEILVETKKGFIKLPCQAKVLNPKEKYSKLKYAKKGVLQIDRLIQYAKKINGHPTYLFYNYVNTSADPENESVEFGCTIGGAYKIKSISTASTRSIGFSDLHPNYCRPFHLMADICHPEFSTRKLKSIFPDLSLKTMKFYSMDELQDEFNWIDLNPSVTGLGYIPQSEFTKSISSLVKTNDNTYRPRYRITIYNNNPNLGMLISLD